MIEMKEEQERAILVAVDTGEYDAAVSLDELEELAQTAGAVVLGKISQKRPAVDKTTCVGSGMLKQIKNQAAALGANLLIFDHELTASQLRNIEEATDLAVVDRTTLILDIFAQRARSREGKLQVELAQQKYRLPRLMGQGTALSRLGGGIGTRGPGESKLESDRRHIRRRIESLEEQLRDLERQRSTRRARRKKDGVITVAIVGYTNVGKSTLLNTLTNDTFQTSGRAPHRDEFVTAGGIALTAVNAQTLESRTHPGLYFCGEVLDIDGVTGGFNFQAAWTTAHAVARALAAEH